MALTRLACPACARMLEIEEESLGMEVECGSCCEVFVAKKLENGTANNSTAKKESRSGTEDKSRRKVRKRRRNEDDDDYEFDHDYDEYDDDDYDPLPSRRQRRYRGEQKSRLLYIV